MSPTNGHAVRRSSRVTARVPVRVTSMDSDAGISEICETLVVNAHGCALHFPGKLDAGSALRLHRRGGREATAYVVFCQPIGADGQGFRLGAQLERPENFWGLETYPEDWNVVEMTPAGQKALKEAESPSTVIPRMQHAQAWGARATSDRSKQSPSRASQEILDKIEEKLSEERLRAVLAGFVEPLRTEVAELREKLSANGRRNRFEVSLGHIPPELEEQLWERIRRDVGTRALQQTREQSAEILGSAKTAVEQKVGAAMSEFRQELARELQGVEARAKAFAAELSGATQQQVRTGIEKLQRHALDTGAHLEAHGEKLARSLERQLAEAHEGYRHSFEQMQVAGEAKAAEARAAATELGARIGTLNESVRRLESELDAHLVGVAGEIVSGAEGELESAAAGALKNLHARAANEIEARLSEMCGHLRTIQNRIEESFAGSVAAQGEGAERSIAERFEELAREATAKWRVGLAKDLNSVAEGLGRQMREELKG
ncbi:MAG TPA: hypothetical protein VMT67_16535 [Terriglobales bacterium]|nr:hypothetical protein [Terriglobales bacterium]